MVTTWRYRLPNERGEGWTIAFLDSIGCFAVLSDYGNYGYRWPEAGWGPGDFREFLVRCDDDYVLRKLAPEDTYYPEETEKRIKEYIVDMRRHCGWTRERAREEWDLLRDWCVDSREEFALWYQHTKIGDAYEFAHWDVSRHAKAFVEKALPRLRAAIRDELAREGVAHASREGGR